MAVLPLQNTSARPEDSDFMANGLSDALASKLGRISALRVTPWITSQNYVPNNSSPVQDIAAEFGVDQLIVGTFNLQGERLQIRLSHVDGATGMMDWSEDHVGVEDDLLDIPQRIAVSILERLGTDVAREESLALASRSTDSPQAWELYQQGVEALRQGSEASTATALGFFQSAVSIDPELAEAQVGIGAVYTTRVYHLWQTEPNSLDKAERAYRLALEQDPQLWGAYRGLVRVAFHRGRSEECLRLGMIARTADPDDLEALQMRAESSVSAGVAAPAIPMLEKVLEIDPANQAAMLFLVYSYNLVGTAPDKMIPLAERYLRRFGADADVFDFMGNSHQSNGDLELARLAYEEALRLRGSAEKLEQKWRLALLETDRGSMEESKASWSRLLEEVMHENNPSSPDARRTIAALELILGSPARFDELWRQRTADSDLGTRLVDACVIAGRLEEAVEILDGRLDRGHFFHLDSAFSWRSYAALRRNPSFQAYLARREELRAEWIARYFPDWSGQ